MSDAAIEGGKLFAIPYQFDRGNPEKNTVLLDHLSEHPLWFAADMSPEEARATAAWMACNAEYWKYEVWSGGTLAGMLILSRVVPRVDALMHFTLLPASETGVTLFSARRLIWNFLGYAFDAFQLQRISAEVPEHTPRLARFLRGRLGFRFEGETDVARLQKNKAAVRLDVPGANTWIAGQGSRRERAHWHDGKWSDLLLLRLLRSEYDARASLGVMPNATHETVTEVSDESPRQASAVSASANGRSATGSDETAPVTDGQWRGRA